MWTVEQIKEPIYNCQSFEKAKAMKKEAVYTDSVYKEYGSFHTGSKYKKWTFEGMYETLELNLVQNQGLLSES